MVDPLPVVGRGLPRLGISSSALGGVSVLRAASILLELGHKVAAPLVDDDGVDLVVDYRVTVQVKASGSLSAPVVRGVPYEGNYVFSLKSRLRADVLVCHAVDIDAWWVIPRSELPDALWNLALCTVPRKRSRAADLVRFRDGWVVFAGAGFLSSERASNV